MSIQPVNPDSLNNDTLALHTMPNSSDTALTHVPSGKRVASFARYHSAGQAFAQLEQLDWNTLTPEGGMTPPLALAVARILVQFEDVDNHAARVTRLRELEAQAVPQLPPPETAIPPELSPDLASAADDHQLMATIRSEAGMLGLMVLWEDDKVLLHWPGEDLDTIELMSYERALHWLSTEAPSLAEHRRQLAEVKQANDVRRLTPGAHAQAMTLLNSIRTDLITDQIDKAERHARQLLALIEKGEAED